MRGKVRSGGPRGTEEETLRLQRERARDHRKNVAMLLGASEKEKLLADKRRSRSVKIAGSKRKVVIDVDSNGGRSKMHKPRQVGELDDETAEQEDAYHGYNDGTTENLYMGAKRQRDGEKDAYDGEFSRGAKRMKVRAWRPPVSPYGLLEEDFYDEPWKLLLSCILLNKTSAVQVRQVVFRLFQLYPTPERLIEASTSELETLLQPLGLFRKRAVAIQRFSKEYIEKDWKDPKELYGIGKYASDAYAIFCLGEWETTQPEDKDLKLYLEFVRKTEGLGVGFMKE